MPPRRTNVRVATTPTPTFARLVQIVNTLPRVNQTGFVQMDGSISTHLARPIMIAQDAIRFSIGQNQQADFDLMADHTNWNRMADAVHRAQQGERFR